MRLALISLLALGAAACPGEPPAVTPDAGQPRRCVGGLLLEDGTCVAKCDPSKCLAGNICVDNKCVLQCSAHSQCKRYSQTCLKAVEDDTLAEVFVCTNTPTQEYGDFCLQGDECNEFCHSSGPGDARSYCTFDCITDSECPGGYECNFVRDPHKICEVNKGNSPHCGTTTEECIPRAELGAEVGLIEGSFCIQRSICLKKEACASCENDVDCSWGFDLACVPTLEGKKCLPPCAQETDCDLDKTCFGGHCFPKTGACTGEGFCSPCRYDTECSPNFACISLHGNEKACIDRTFPNSCNSDADCPMSPGGRRGACLDHRHQVATTSSVYHRCYAPHNGDFFTCY